MIITLNRLTTIKHLINFSIYHKKPSDTYTVLGITVLFFVVALFGIINHELWMDESHHFLLGRDSISFIDLYNNTRYDGHPILWNYLAHLISQITTNPFYIQLIHILISTLSAYVFLKKAPLSLWFKIGFLLSYFMLYEYTVISRNYNLGMLFLFLSCSTYSSDNNKFTLLSIYLALCCNSHSIFIIVSIAMMISIFIQHFNKLKFLFIKLYWKGYLIFTIGLLLAFAQIIPKSDTVFFDRIDYSSTYEIFKSILSVLKALIPIADYSQIKYWNTFYFLENFRTLSIIAGVLVWLLPLILFNKKRNVIIFVYLTFIGFILFEIVTRTYGVRYNGLLFLTLIAGLWIGYVQNEKPLIKRNISKYNAYILTFLIVIQAFAGTTAYALDIKKVFNHGENVADFIEKNNIDIEQIITGCDSASINVYLKENLYHICYNKPQGFYLWNVDCSAVHSLEENQLIEAAFLAKKDKEKLFLILSKPLNGNKFNVNNRQYSSLLITKFTEAVTKDYYIYRIQKN